MHPTADSPNGHSSDTSTRQPALLTLFASRTAVTGERRAIDWPSWLTTLAAPPAAAAIKTRLPGWSPATFLDDRRGNDRVEAVYALVLDADDGGSLEQAQAAFGDWQALLHTTYSHGATSKNGQPCPPRVCFRLILPLSRAVTTDEHGRLWQWAAERAAQFGLRLDPAPKAPGQFWYLPAVRPGAEPSYRARLLVGPPLDPDAVLDGADTPSQPSLPTATPSAPQRDRQGGGASPPPQALPPLEERRARGIKLLAQARPALQGHNGSAALMRRVRGPGAGPVPARAQRTSQPPAPEG